MHFLSIAERHYLVPQNVSQSTKTLFPEKYEEEMIQRTKETPVKKYWYLEWQKGDPKDFKSIWPHFDTPKDIEKNR